MAQTIWKWQLSTTDKQFVQMPEAAQILSIQEQNGTPCIWAYVNPEAKKEWRTFQIFGTGHPIQQTEGESMEFIGTYQLRSGALVFHLFEITQN